MILSNKNIYIILIIVFFIISASIIFSIFIYNIVNSDVNILDTDIIKVNRIYDLLQQVTCELDRNNIPYIITGGTLLGSVRHSGMIPWDDDADLAIVINGNITLNEQKVFKQKVIDCLQILNKNNINTFEHSVGNILNSHFINSSSCLDIFFIQSKDENIYRYLEPFDTKYENEYFTYSEIFPIKEYTFGPITLKGPNNSVNFLDRTYSNWRTIASKWNHYNQNPLNSNQKLFSAVLPDTSDAEFPWIKKECSI